jgi:hypothetical protein
MCYLMHSLARILKFSSIQILVIATMPLWYLNTYSQVCSNPTNVIYGVTSAGNIFPITVSTGIVGTQINAPFGGNAPINPNGIGYNALNGRFYFFKRAPSNPPQEFISYDPVLGSTTMLSSCPTPNTVYVGCLTANGQGYYCWDSQARLFYYNVMANAWTLITSDLRDQFGKDVDSILRAHGSGDAAIDGSGNMIMLPASNARFGVFRMNRSLPTAPVASLVVTEVLPMGNPPGKFVGIALNSTGQIFMNTATPQNRLYRLENNLSLTLISTLSTSMDDLTSCNYPFGVLEMEFKNFSAQLKGKSVQLKWDNLLKNESTYFIQRSADATHWSEIGSAAQSGNASTLSFIDNNPGSPFNHYRIYLVSPEGSRMYSEIKLVNVIGNTSFALYPNPVEKALCIQSSGIAPRKTVASVFDQTGRKLKEFVLSSGTNWIDLKFLPPGKYIVVLRQADEPPFTYAFVKK